MSGKLAAVCDRMAAVFDGVPGEKYERGVLVPDEGV
jgi:hypothetical protein